MPKYLSMKRAFAVCMIMTIVYVSLVMVQPASC